MKIKKLFIATGTSLITMGSVLPSIMNQAINIQQKNKTSKNVNTIIITKKTINDFIDSVHKTILYSGEVEHGYIYFNKWLNLGIKGLTFGYGISKSKDIDPQKYLNDYTLLRNMNNTNYFFVKIINVDSKYVLEDMSKIIFPIGEVNSLIPKTVSSYSSIKSTTSNRTYFITLSVEDTNSLWEVIQYTKGETKEEIIIGGGLIFRYLVDNPSYNWGYTHELYIDLRNFDDITSFLITFQMTQTNIWYGYEYKWIYERLQKDADLGKSIKINLRVNFQFLRNNLYGIELD